MKTLGKMLLSKIVTVVLVLALLAGGLYWFRHNLVAIFNGTTHAEYSFVIKRFEKESQLVVAGAEVKATGEQVFTNNALKKWPDWTKAVTKVFVGRDMTAIIPVKTEFKLELKGIDKDDIAIHQGVLTFKQPLTVYVDSQQEGTITIDKASNGLVDKVVDAFTSGKKAQEFLSEKSQEAIYKTSEKLLSDEDKLEKVVMFSEEALENLINLGAEKPLEVDLDRDDLVFVIQDKV